MKKLLSAFLSLILLLSTILPSIGYTQSDVKEPALSVKPAKTTIQIQGGEESEYSDPNSSVFPKEKYSFEVKRDYNQLVNITVKNPKDKAQAFKLIVKNAPQEVPIDFIKEGSSADPYILFPNEEKEVVLGIHTQNALKSAYVFQIQAIDTSTNKSLGQATVDLTVDFSGIDFSIKEIETNPYTLAKKYEVTNTGKTITDLQLTADDTLLPYLTFEPVIENVKLEQGQTVQVTVKPSLKDVVPNGKKGTLILKGANKEKNISVDFNPGSKQVHSFSLQDLYSKNQQNTIKQDWQITNPIKGELTEAGGSLSGGMEENETGQKFTYSITAAPAEQPMDKPIIDVKTVGDKTQVYTKMTLTGAEYQALLNSVQQKEESKTDSETRRIKAAALDMQDIEAGAEKVLAKIYVVETVVEATVAEGAYAYGSINGPPVVSAPLYVKDTATYFSNAVSMSYYYERGEISTHHYVGYLVVGALQVGTGAAGVMTGNPGLGLASYLFGIAAEKLYEDSGMKGKPGLGGLFFSSLFGYACINVGTLRHQLSTPNYIGASNVLDYAYVNTRIHRYNDSDYIAEDFKYTLNNHEIFNATGQVIEGALGMPFPTKYINWDGKNTLIQKNTNRNKGNYIVNRDTTITVPVKDDFKIDLIGDDRNDASNGLDDYNEIQKPMPDFAVFPEDIQVADPNISEGKQTKLQIRLHNLGIVGHETAVKVYDNNQLIKEAAVYPKFGKPATIEIPWKPGEGNHDIKVVINEQYAQSEKNLANNTAKRAVTVLPQDKEGPKLTEKHPAGETKDNENIAFMLTDQSSIKSVNLLVDGTEIKATKLNSAKNRFWTKLEKPLSPGQHTVKVTAEDSLGNQTVESWAFTVVDSENVASIKFKQETYELKERHSFDISQQLEIFNTEGKMVSIPKVIKELTFSVENVKPANAIHIRSNSTISAEKEGTAHLVVKYGDKTARTIIKVLPIERVTYNVSFNTSSDHSWPSIYGKRKGSNYYNYLGVWDYRFASADAQNSSITFSMLKEQYDQHEFMKAVFAANDTLYMTDLNEQTNIQLTNQEHSKIAFPANLQIQSVSITPYLDGSHKMGGVIFEKVNGAVYVPKGKYDLSIVYRIDNKIYSYSAKELEIKEAEHTIDVNAFSVSTMQLSLNPSLQVSRLHLYNRQQRIDVPVRGYKSGDQLYLKAGEYDMSLGIDDSIYYYELNANKIDIQENEQKTLPLSSNFSAGIEMESSPYQAEQTISFNQGKEKLFIQNEQGFKLQYLYPKNSGGNVKGLITLVNKNNKEEYYEYSVDLVHSVINLPNTSGTFEVIYTVKELDDGTEPTQSEEDQTETKVPPGSGGGSSGGYVIPPVTPHTPSPEFAIKGPIVMPGNTTLPTEFVSYTVNSLEPNKKSLKVAVSGNIVSELGKLEEIDTLSMLVDNVEGVSDVELVLPFSVVKALTEKNSGSKVSITGKLGKLNVPLASLDQYVKASEEGTLTVKIAKTDIPANLKVNLNGEPVSYSTYVSLKNGQVQQVNSDKIHTLNNSLAVGTSVQKNKATVIKIKKDGRFEAVPAVFNNNIANFKGGLNGTYAVTENSVTFSDVPQNFWNKEQIEKLASKYIVKGHKDGTFGPNEATTRIQLAALLTRSLGLTTETKYDGRFKDVKGSESYVPELMAAVEAGIIKGKEDGAFAPNDKVTRIQTAAMVSRALKYMEFNKAKLDTSKKISQLKDAQAIGAWAKGDVEILIQADVLAGKTNGAFDPNGYTTRAQMVRILDQSLKFLELIN